MENNSGVSVGVDLGSRTIKVVLMRLSPDGATDLSAHRVADNTGNPQRTAEILIEQLLQENEISRSSVKRSVMTGYGRYLLGQGGDTYPETVCMVRGLMAQVPGFPSECTVLDIGG